RAIGGRAAGAALIGVAAGKSTAVRGVSAVLASSRGSRKTADAELPVVAVTDVLAACDARSAVAVAVGVAVGDAVTDDRIIPAVLLTRVVRIADGTVGATGIALLIDAREAAPKPERIVAIRRVGWAIAAVLAAILAAATRTVAVAGGTDACVRAAIELASVLVGI